MQIDHLTPDGVILDELGRRLARVRKQRGRSQQDLAKEAGIGVATLRRIEDGTGGQLSSWLKILKALGMEAAIEGLLPENFDSPMAEVLGEAKRSRRRRRTERHGFTWGDERR